MSVHFYTAPSQPLTRWRDPYTPRLARWHRNNQRRCVQCHRCGHRRWARNLRVLVYYDVVRIFCAEGCTRRRR